MPDTDKREEPRVYGQADDTNRTPRAPQGMRGENNDTLAPPDPALAHEEQVAGGRTVIVNEANGVGYVEATGRASPQSAEKADDEAKAAEA